MSGYFSKVSYSLNIFSSQSLHISLKVPASLTPLSSSTAGIFTNPLKIFTSPFMAIALKHLLVQNENYKMDFLMNCKLNSY